MVTTTANKAISKPAVGDTGWGVTINSDFDAIDAAFGNSIVLTNTTSFSLTAAQCQNMCLTFTGATTADITVTSPASVAGQWVIRNQTPFSVIMKSASGTPTVTVPAGAIRSVYCDGTSNGFVFADGQDAGSNSQVIFNSSGSLSGSSDLTFDGAVLSVGASIALTGAATTGSGPYTATVTFSGSKVIPSGDTIIISGVTPVGYNGTWTVTASSAGSASYTVPTALTSGSGGSVTYGTVKAGGTAVSVPNQDENRTASVTTTAVSDGAKSTGTYTPVAAGGNMRYITNAGAFTLAAPSTSSSYTMVIQITNVTGAGAITLSGFTKTSGSTFTTTVGNVFLVYITIINGSKFANVVAMQ